MQTIRRLLTRVVTGALITGLIVVTTLLVEHHMFARPSPTEIDDGGDWERLGVNFEPHEDREPPGIASLTGPPDLEHPQARSVINEEMRDASPEERAIWHDEMKCHSPDEIREMLALRRRFWPTSSFPGTRDIQLSSAEESGLLPVPEPALTPSPRAPGNALAILESAIDTLQTAEEIVFHNVNDELAELRRLREQLTTLRRLRSEFSGSMP